MSCLCLACPVKRCGTLRCVDEKTANSSNFICGRVADERFNECSKPPETDAAGAAAFRGELVARRVEATRLPPNTRLSALRRRPTDDFATPSQPAVDTLFESIKALRLARAEHASAPLDVQPVASAPKPPRKRGARAAKAGSTFRWNQEGLETTAAFAAHAGLFDEHTTGAVVLAAMKQQNMAPPSLAAGRVDTVVKALRVAVTPLVCPHAYPPAERGAPRRCTPDGRLEPVVLLSSLPGFKPAAACAPENDQN